jgi:DNA gyrase subunit B
MSENSARFSVETIEAIRLRPAMYVGDTTQRGLHALAAELVNDGVAEVASGFGTQIAVTLHEDGSVEIEDDGRPIATTPLESFGGRMLFEVAFQDIVIGARLRGPQPVVVGNDGLNRIGFTPVNALSEWLHVESGDGNSIWNSEYWRGIPTGQPARRDGDWTGLRIRFLPDHEVFQTIEFSGEWLRRRFIDLAGLRGGLPIRFRNVPENSDELIQFNDGVASLVRLLAGDSKSHYDEIPTVQCRTDDFRLDVAFQHTNSQEMKIRSFVNAVESLEGGTHCTGFKRGLTRAVNQSLKNCSLERVIDGKQLSRGLRAIVSIWVDDPTFEGPTKTRFGHSAVEGTVESIVYRGLLEYFAREPEVLKQIANTGRCLGDAR